MRLPVGRLRVANALPGERLSRPAPPSGIAGRRISEHPPARTPNSGHKKGRRRRRPGVGTLDPDRESRSKLPLNGRGRMPLPEGASVSLQPPPTLVPISSALDTKRAARRKDEERPLKGEG